MFLLDTCVVSEGAKSKRDDNVSLWLSQQHSAVLYISAISAGELHYGVGRLVPGREADRLRQWLQATLHEGFPGRILPFDAAVAELWGKLRAEVPNAELVDSQIAATALMHGLTLVTRNVRDFRFPSLAVFNPWKK